MPDETPEPINVYLDVDGVLNAVALGYSDGGWPQPHRQVESNGWALRVAPQLVLRLNALAALPHVHMHWLTTWCESAQDPLSADIGLDGADWPVVGLEEHRTATGHRWWKLDAIRAHLPDDRRALWIDDDISFDPDAREWLAQTPRVTAISPRTSMALTPRQMRKMEDVAGRLA